MICSRFKAHQGRSSAIRCVANVSAKVQLAVYSIRGSIDPICYRLMERVLSFLPDIIIRGNRGIISLFIHCRRLTLRRCICFHRGPSIYAARFYAADYDSIYVKGFIRDLNLVRLNKIYFCFMKSHYCYFVDDA